MSSVVNRKFEFSRNYPSGYKFLSGAVSATITAAALQPFDVIRTVQQGNSFGASKAVNGILATSRSLIASEGVSGLWRGLGPTLIRVFFGAGIYFWSINSILDVLGRTSQHAVHQVKSTVSAAPSAANSFVAGVGARCLAASIMSPVAVVKTRMEWLPPSQRTYSSTAGGLLTIARQEGFGALYSGLLPTLARDAPFSGIYVMLYKSVFQPLFIAQQYIYGLACSQARKALIYSSFYSCHAYYRFVFDVAQTLLPSVTVRNFIAALGAGAAATLMTQPADIVRTRLQLETPSEAFTFRSSGRRLVQVGAEIWKKSGVSGFFVGSTARVLKRGVNTAFTWTLFEEAMRRGGASGGGG